jgi:hypothetical protein
MTQAANGNGQARGNGFLTPGGPIKDNHIFLQWLEQSRFILHTGGLELGIVAAEMDARLRKVHKGIIVGGLTSGYRARRVSKPISDAAEALIVASQYLITASNRFEAVYTPELEEVGYQNKTVPTFTFKGSH